MLSEPVFTRREVALSVFLGLLLAATAAAMVLIVGSREITWMRDPSTQPVAVAGIALAVFAGSSALSLASFRFAPHLHYLALRKNPLRRLRLDWSPRGVLPAWAIVVLLWVPWMFLQFPTGMSNDTFEQLYEFQTGSPTYYYALGITLDASFVDHHPVFDTLLYGAFQALGDCLGSQNVGVFLFAVLQSLVTSLSLAASCCYLDELGASKPARLFALAFVALFPFLPAYAMTMVKDSTFCAVFVPFVLVYLRIWQTRGAWIHGWRRMFLLLVLVCLCILTKKTGAIVCAVSLLALLFWCRGRRFAIAAELAGSLVICMALVPMFVYPAIGGVANGGRQEAFGIAYQQVVTAQRDYGDLTEDEITAMNGVMDFQTACEKWSSSTVDPVKARAHYSITRDQYLAFAQAYLSVGLRHPDSYAASVLSVAIPMLCPGTAMGYYGTPRQEQWRVKSFYQHDEAGEMHFDVSKPAEVSKYSAPVQRAVYAVFGSEAGSLLFGMGTFGGWVPLFCFVLSLRRDAFRYLVAFAPLLVSVLLLLVCPASPTRYVLPMICTVPLMFGLLAESLCGHVPLARFAERRREDERG